MGALVLVLLLAQETQPAAWSSHQKAADIASTVAVAGNIAGAAWEASHAPDRGHAFGCFALRNLIVYGATTVVKQSVKRWRPDHSNQQSFYSGHTAFAAVNQWNLQVSIPITIGAGYGRAAANRHYWTDIGVGAAVGFISRRVCEY